MHSKLYVYALITSAALAVAHNDIPGDQPTSTGGLARREESTADALAQFFEKLEAMKQRERERAKSKASETSPPLIVDDLDAALSGLDDDDDDDSRTRTGFRTIVSTVSGKPVTLVTSAGGPGFTLATQGSTTVISGTTFTVATSASTTLATTSSTKTSSSSSTTGSTSTSMSTTNTRTGITATETTINSSKATIVTSFGGPAITLASKGFITSFGGSTYTVTSSTATANNLAASRSNSAPGYIRPFELAASHVLSGISVVGSAIVGAWLVL